MATARKSRSPKRRVNGHRFLDKRQFPDLPEARGKLLEYLGNLDVISAAALDAIREIPRHGFASPALWRMAYLDTELWSPAAFLPRPSVVARLVTAVERSKAAKVLEYATGTGYVTCVLALVAKRVDTVEHDPWQLWMSSDAFRELEISNISQKASDGRLGWPERGPYDAIVVSAAMPRIPRVLIEQLVEAGICLAPVGPYSGPHRMLQATKSPEGVSVTDLGWCTFPPLTGVWGPADLVWTGPEIEDEPRGFGAGGGQAQHTGLSFGDGSAR